MGNSKALCNTNFKPLPGKDFLYQIASKILARPVHNYWSFGSRSDAGDILMRLIDSPGWCGKLDLTKTENGGFQWDANTRIFELRESLKPHGFGIACLERRIPGQRKHTSYRLCLESEVLRDDRGRVIPYRDDAASNSELARNLNPKPRTPEQANIFEQRKQPSREFSRFLAMEMGVRQ